MRKLTFKRPAALLAAALAFGAFTSVSQAATVDVSMLFEQGNGVKTFQIDFSYDEAAYPGDRQLGLAQLNSFTFKHNGVIETQLNLDKLNFASSYFSYDTADEMIVPTTDDYGIDVKGNAQLALKLVTTESSGQNFWVRLPSNPSNTYQLYEIGVGKDLVNGKLAWVKVERPDTPSPVPLPAGGFLLIGALGGLALLRRKKSEAMPA